MGDYYNKEELHELFPLGCQSVPTRGTQDGVILKFQTFYLKIYDTRDNNSYIVSGYRYHDSQPVFEEVIPVNQFRKYAAQFRKEDYLYSHTSDRTIASNHINFF